MSLKAAAASTVALSTLFFASTSFALTKQECIGASERGQSFRDEGKLMESRQQFLICVQESCPRPVADACREDLAAVEKRLPTVVLSARSGSGSDLIDVTVSIDGAVVTQKLDGRAVPLNPGAHKVKFEAKGQSVDEQVVVIEGEKSRPVRVSFPAAPGEAPPTPAQPPATPAGGDPNAQRVSADSGGVPAATWILGGVSVLSLGAMGIFWAKGSGDLADLREGCGKTKTCDQNAVDSAKTKVLIGDIFLGVGIVAAGAAIYFALAPRSAPNVSVGVSGLGANLRAKF